MTKRFLAGEQATSAGFGPTLGLTGHVALFPLVRVGGYASAELSPAEGSSARRFLAVGARAKILSPWPRAPFRAWLFFGAGYVGAYSPSFERTLMVRPDPELPPQPTNVAVAGAGGGFLEIPVGIGASYKLRKPWEITAELGARFGVAFSGSNYGGRAASTPEGLEVLLLPVGKDAVALGLTVGIALDR